MKRAFWIVVAAQLLFLVGEAAQLSRRVATGTELWLKVEPVDPRSLFTGHYLALQYDISRLDLARVPCDVEPGPGERVFVGLTTDVPARAVRVSRRPVPGDGLCYLAATVGWRHEQEVRLDYGLDRWYIAETRRDDALALEKRLRQPSPPAVLARVSVASDGIGLLKAITVDGQPFE